MWKRTLRRGTLWCILTVGAPFACDTPRVEEWGGEPHLENLPILLTIHPSERFRPSDIARIDECRLILVGGAWGNLIELDLVSGEERWLGQLAGAPTGTRLYQGASGVLLAKSGNPSRLFEVRTGEGRILERDLPLDPWTRMPVTGEVATVGGGRIAVATTNGRTEESPRPWVRSPLVWLVNEDGTVAGTLGEIEDAGGRYLSSVMGRVSIGAMGDSLILVGRPFAATVDWYRLRGAFATFTRTTRLPAYFSAPPPWEDVWRTPWLDVGGAHVRTYSIPHFREMSFTSDGQLWAIRNGNVHWESRDSRLGREVFALSGNWRAGRQWLEAYDPTGTLLGAYKLDGSSVRSVVPDGWGAVTLLYGDGTVAVARSPHTSTPVGCPRRETVEFVIKSADEATPRGGTHAP